MKLSVCIQFFFLTIYVFCSFSVLMSYFFIISRDDFWIGNFGEVLKKIRQESK